jgi:Uma2 family endonuclease
VTKETKEKATYDDLYEVPDELVAEIADGELFTSPRPSPRHARVSSSLGGELHRPYDRGRGGPGGWIILDEPELHLDENVLVPDLAGWRRERMPTLPETAWIEVAPDWVCEVISASTARLDRVHKLPLYAKFRVGHLWLIDPSPRTLEVYELDQGGWRLLSSHGDDDSVQVEPFDAIPLELASLWD